jgi:hypothetical protein
MHFHAVHGDLTMNPIMLTPFGLLAWFFIQAPASLGEYGMFKGLIETCVLGFLLVIVLRNQETRWQATLKTSEDRFANLLGQMEKTMAEDIELRGKIISEMEAVKKAKFCVYDMDQARAVAAEIVKLTGR